MSASLIVGRWAIIEQIGDVAKVNMRTFQCRTLIDYMFYVGLVLERIKYEYIVKTCVNVSRVVSIIHHLAIIMQGR